MTLLLHTSSPTIRIGVADGDRMLARDEFPSDRNLAATFADRIHAFLTTHNSALRTLNSIVVHAGPHSAPARASHFATATRDRSRGRPGGFTTLRIGVTTANALAYALRLPIIGVTGLVVSLDELLRRAGTAAPALKNLVLPVYDREPHIGPVRTP